MNKNKVGSCNWKKMAGRVSYITVAYGTNGLVCECV
jgi:hypothetical protein